MTYFIFFPIQKTLTIHDCCQYQPPEADNGCQLYLQRSTDFPNGSSGSAGPKASEVEFCPLWKAQVTAIHSVMLSFASLADIYKTFQRGRALSTASGLILRDAE